MPPREEGEPTSEGCGRRIPCFPGVAASLASTSRQFLTALRSLQSERELGVGGCRRRLWQTASSHDCDGHEHGSCLTALKQTGGGGGVHSFQLLN